MTCGLRRERGSALVASMLLVSLLLLVISAVTARATHESQAVVRQERKVQALNAAEAGLAEAVQRLQQDAFLPTITGEVGRGAFSVAIEHGSEPGTWRSAVVTSKGSCEDQTREIRAVLAIRQIPPAVFRTEVRLIQWEALPRRTVAK